ncbi:uncharacterized protein Z520_01785 [Fonsecaea multimorphosa CBS 102226]|uniref:Uncharacterized protein n=1 Tax=Fonsecaea multimorphosa CBS 102226 TaxID=1442371 RepID=A0A0D2KXT7_9EURO|nr:uncharacterized protein Z520_01785 [Fonsecaea multimorphosa CBS 102226]KIY01649.1 hypothetical protein Z520_01785 [Fonsecaea multimorphosa CBS 102226]OAL29846.1 hypothetical protein AYO22_01752 [Fonsecaea multimorphosa]
MPVTTRSKGSQKQTHLEDFDNKEANEARNQNPKSKRAPPSTTKKQSPKARSQNKRKQPGNQTKTEETPRPTKKQKQKQTSINPDEDVPPTEETSKPVVINRAPVLQLWAACVSQTLYPALPWSTHLSIGSAISTLCAISKGRAIGVMEPPSDDPAKRDEKERKKRAAEEGADDEVNVMRFRLLLKDGAAVVSGKPHKANEELLKGKFGDGDGYERIKRAMEEAIETWKNKGHEEEELNGKAFHMYEQFRPSVQSGQGGWGRKGELRPEKIKAVVAGE